MWQFRVCMGVGDYRLKLSKEEHQRMVSKWWRGLNMISLQCETPEEFQLWTSKDKIPDALNARAIKHRRDQATKLATKIEAKLLIWVNDLGGGSLKNKRGGNLLIHCERKNFWCEVWRTGSRYYMTSQSGWKRQKQTHALYTKKNKNWIMHRSTF